jgi:hypothetical protein
MFFPLVQTAILDTCLTRLTCYLPKGKFVCLACHAPEKINGAGTLSPKHYRTRNLIDRAQSRRHLFVIPKNAHWRCTNIALHSDIRRTLLLSLRRSDRCFRVKMIIRVRKGQTNKHDTLIAEGDRCFGLTGHHRLPGREKLPGYRGDPGNLGKCPHLMT